MDLPCAGVGPLARIIDDARTAGASTEAADLENLYSLPEGAVNVAPLWLAATAPLEGAAYTAAAGSLPVVGSGEDKVPPPGTPWERQAEVEQHLARYAASLVQMHEAAQIGGPGRYPTDFSRGFAMLLPHCNQLRSGARLLELEARCGHGRATRTASAESLHTMFQLAESLEREPVIISQMVRDACAALAVATLNDLLPHVAFSDEDLARLQDDLAAPITRPV